VIHVIFREGALVSHVIFREGALWATTVSRDPHLMAGSDTQPYQRMSLMSLAVTLTSSYSAG
jgi:hypothetical protein